MIPFLSCFFERMDMAMRRLAFWKRFFVAVLLIFAICMSVMVWKLSKALRMADMSLGECERLWNLQNYVESEYYKDIDETVMMDHALKGYMNGLDDPYSNYLTAEEYSQWQSNEAGISVGIGVTVTFLEEEGTLQIMEVNAGSPAELAGLQINDQIFAVDGELVADLGYQEAVNRVRGEEGTSVVLTILREEIKLEKTVSRVEMEVTSAYGVMLEDQIGYIRIASFKENTVEQFLTALQTLLQNHAKGLVFDLRNDGGGLVNSLQKILDPLLPAGDIATATYGNGETKVLVTSDANELNLPMAVLVNGNTASAAELFTAALQDFEKAEVVGEQTFGKGIMQSTSKMADGGAVTLTVATYQTTKGVCYHEVGITPDVIIEEDYERIDFDHPDPSNDAQLRQAIELLQL